MIFWPGRNAAAPLTRADGVTLVWLGFIGYYTASFLDFRGLEYISAALERLILFTYPAIVVVLSAVMLGKRIEGREVLAVMVSYLGIGLVFLGDLRVSARPRDVWIGSGLVLLSALTYSFYLVGNEKVVRRIGSMRLTGVAMAASSLFMAVHFLLTRPAAALLVSPRVLWISVALAVFSTSLPILLTTVAIQRIGASRVGVVGSIGPICTIALGAVFLGEPFGVVHMIGAGLVLGGVWIVSRPGGR